MMSQALRGKVALVAGATRGAGRGIAVELGAAGATVYVTGAPPARNVPNTTVPKRSKRRPSWCNTRAATASRCKSIIWSRRGYKRWWRASRVSTVASMFWSTMCGGRISWPSGTCPCGSTPWKRHAPAAARHRHAYHHQPLRAPLLIKNPGGLVVEMTDGTAEYNSANYRLSLFYDLAKTSVIRMAWAQAQELRPHQVHRRRADSGLVALGNDAG